MENIEFTKTELEFLEEMIDFPKVYSLSNYGLKTVKAILDKMKNINFQYSVNIELQSKNIQ